MSRARIPLKCDDCGGRLERDGRCRTCDPSVFADELAGADAVRYRLMREAKRAAFDPTTIPRYDAALTSYECASVPSVGGVKLPKACPRCLSPMQSEQSKRCYNCQPGGRPPKPSDALRARVNASAKVSTRKGGGS